MSLQLAAQHLASQGRNGDSTLVHMTPSEVKGLQDLALMHGGSLTINPTTGLPEASFLSSILPTIAGFALNTFMPGFGTAIGEIFSLGSAAGTAIGVGAVTGLAKGSISEGLMAGMGAYGGANLSEGMMGAGAQELGKNATSQFADVATKGPNVAGNPAVPTTASAWDKISAGATSGHVGDYMKTMGGPSLMQSGLMAASPILADAMVPTTTKAPPVQNTAFIRQKIYDPGTGTYRSLTPVAASDWGNRSFSDIYAANGGIMSSDKVKHYANGGYGSFSPEQVASYIQNNNLDAAGAAAAAKTFGVSDDILSQGMGLLRQDDQTGVAAASSAYQNAASPTQNAANLDFMRSQGLNSMAPDEAYTPYVAPVSTATTNPFVAPVSTATTTPTATTSTAATNPFAATSTAAAPVTTAAGSSDVNISDPNWVNATLQKINADAEARQVAKDKLAAQASTVTPFDKAAQDRLAAQFAPLNANAAQQQAATAKRQQQAEADAASAALAAKNAPAYQAKLDADEKARLAGLASTQTGTATDSTAKTTSGLASTTAAQDLGSQAYQAATNTGGIGVAGLDTNISNYVANVNPATLRSMSPSLETPTAVEARIRADMQSNGVSEADIFRATGQTVSQIAAKPFVGSIREVIGAVGSGGSTGAGVTGGGSIVNANGSITTSPVISGIPEGGFDNMADLVSTYTGGGGSTGYVSPVPKSYQALENKYSRSANQQAIMDYMQGKPGAKYPTKPIIEGGGEISRSYREVQGYPASSNKQWNYDPRTQQYSKNRDYVPMNRDKGGDPVYGMSLNAVKQAYTDQAVTDADLFTWMNTQDLTPQDLSDALGIPLSAVMAKFGTKKVAADGGMMYAGGGTVTKDADGVEHKVMDNGTAWIRRNPFMAWERDLNYSMSDPYASSSTKGQEASGGSPSPSLGRDNGTYSGLTGPDSVFGQDPANVGVTDAVATAPDNSLGSGISPGDKAGAASAPDGPAPGAPGGPDAGDPDGADGGGPGSGGNSSGGGNGPGDARGGFIDRGLFDQRYPSHGEGTLGSYSDGGRLLRGPGDGVSDSIPATIGGRQPARLADGEFVVPARIVSELGNGSTEAGARKLYAMLDRIQAHRGKSVGKGKVAVNSRADKFLPA